MSLTYRENTTRPWSCAECLIGCFTCCFTCCVKQSIPEVMQQIVCHPTFGDVIISQQIKNEELCINCSGRVVCFVERPQLTKIRLILQLWVKNMK